MLNFIEYLELVNFLENLRALAGQLTPGRYIFHLRHVHVPDLNANLLMYVIVDVESHP